MANLTLANYVSLVKGYMNQARAAATTNNLFPDTDIKAELNAAQVEIVRRVGLDFFRTTATQNATTGDITVPSAILADATCTLVVNASEDRRALPVKSLKALERKNPNWRWQTAEYPTNIVRRTITSSGLVIRLYPQPTATITDGLFWEGALRPTDMALDADECAVLAFYPDLQRTLLPAGALRNLYYLTGGEDDDQAQKWSQQFESDLTKLAQYEGGWIAGPDNYIN